VRRSRTASGPWGPSYSRDDTRRWLREVLHEDRTEDDLTTALLLPSGSTAVGCVEAQAPGIVAGIAVVVELLRMEHLRSLPRKADGDRVRRGTTVLEIEGDARRILAIERTLLNLLMHLSGVATMTAEARRRAGTGQAGGPEIYATRKTIPGLRDLEKWAVTLGGGRPHRRDLSDGILIKNNHLALLPLPVAVQRAQGPKGRGLPVEVEVRTGAQAVAAVRSGAIALLIDNASPAKVRAIVRTLERQDLRKGVHIEVSGGITPRTVHRYRATGADAASLGALTHSAPALPFHLTVTPK
jgi:nicotinate-nucleotide pyrophosphorylase (carboxylating)